MAVSQNWTIFVTSSLTGFFLYVKARKMSPSLEGGSAWYWVMKEILSSSLIFRSTSVVKPIGTPL